MDGISVVITIINREQENDYDRIINGNGVATVFSTPGYGTARASVLELLGLERTEKTVLSAMTTRTTAKRLMRDFVSALGINTPGGGIAFSLPVGSAGGAKALRWLVSDIDSKAEGENMTREFPYDLIVAVAQRDASSAVMDAARKAGARGGTIVHAKGTAGEFAEKFYGMTIAAEKELVLIVARHEMKDDIMRAIMQAGKDENARAAVFSMPVETVEGMTGVKKAGE